MGAVKRATSQLLRMLDRQQKEAKRLPVIIDKLEEYLKKKPKEIIDWSLFLLQYRIEAEAAKRTPRLPVIIVSPDSTVSLGDTNDVASDSWLKRLRSEGFSVLTLEQFQSFIKSLQLQVKQEDYMPAINFLKANAKLQLALPFPVSYAGKPENPHKPPVPSKWKPSDFGPAPFPLPPLPKGLFKD